FESADFFDKTFGEHDLVVSLDVIEHIYKEYEETYVKALADHVNDGGIVVCGTPNETTTPYASKLSREAHVNMYSQERLRTLFEKYFQNVFSFGMNDEVVHTGFAKMAQYLFVVACNKR
ncbi:MAG: class I SAM-dependent methyltransferase, partial [Chlamydiae bacterium]|nr:class I SAM-dependent methyltransferase [Chlamydiota bacterium]